MNGYMRIKEASDKWKLINTLCLRRRIRELFGNTWAILDDAEQPKGEPVKICKYIKEILEGE